MKQKTIRVYDSELAYIENKYFKKSDKLYKQHLIGKHLEREGFNALYPILRCEGALGGRYYEQTLFTEE